MTLQAYLTADMQASLDDAPMTYDTGGTSWYDGHDKFVLMPGQSYCDRVIVIVKNYPPCPHCDGIGVLGYRWGAEGVIEDVCSACKGRGRMPDVDDVDGIPF